MTKYFKGENKSIAKVEGNAVQMYLERLASEDVQVEEITEKEFLKIAKQKQKKGRRFFPILYVLVKEKNNTFDLNFVPTL